MNNGLKYGVMYGVLASVIALIQHFFFPGSLLSPIQWVISLGLPIFFMYMAAKTERVHQDGIITFGEALVPSFLTYAIGSLLSIFAGFAMLNFIPGLKEKQAELAGEMTEAMGAKMKEMMPEGAETLDVAQMKAEAIDNAMNMGIGQMLASWLMMLVVGLIIALIIAAIVKRTPSA